MSKQGPQRPRVSGGRRWPLLVAATALGLLSIPFGTWLLYLGGLRLLPDLPEAPASPLSASETASVFRRWDWQDDVAVRPLNVRGLFGVLTCESLSPWRDPRSCRSDHPGLMAASRVAQRHLGLGGVGGEPGWSEALQHASLTAWVSRHWQAEEVAAFLAEVPPRASSAEP